MIASLQTRLLLAVSVLAVAAVAAVALSVREGTRREFRKFQDLQQRRPATSDDVFSASLRERLAAACCAPAEVRAAVEELPADHALVITGARGAMLAHAVSRDASLTIDRATFTNGVLELSATRAGETMALNFRGHPRAEIVTAAGERAVAHVIQVPSPSGDPVAARFLVSVDLRILWGTTFVALAAIGLTWLVTRRIVRPIAALQRAAADLAGGDFSRRVEVRGQDEMAALGHSFNAMSAELQRQLALRRALVSDVAHELRTPLTGLQCRLETVIDRVAPDPSAAIAAAHEEVLHLSRLVDDLQELALAEARELRLTIERVSLADVVRSAARATGLEADPRLAIDVPPGLAARADATRLRQVLVNLLSNADRHTPPDGRIHVTARAADGRISVVVHNTGSHVPDEEIERLFDRFYRADPARQRATGGTGLGLAIVKHLVEAHGGTVSAQSDGDGFAVTVTLEHGDVAHAPQV